MIIDGYTAELLIDRAIGGTALKESVKALQDVFVDHDFAEKGEPMSELIDRQAAITAICEDGTWLESQGCTEITMCERKQRDADILSELPTVDAVKVVRCKDCKHNSLKRMSGNTYCELEMGLFQLYDFCSRGERKDDGV